jgi:hypothetical protein
MRELDRHGPMGYVSTGCSTAWPPPAHRFKLVSPPPAPNRMLTSPQVTAPFVSSALSPSSDGGTTRSSLPSAALMLDASSGYSLASNAGAPVTNVRWVARARHSEAAPPVQG